MNTYRYTAEFQIQTRFIFVHCETPGQGLAFLRKTYPTATISYDQIDHSHLADFRL